MSRLPGFCGPSNITRSRNVDDERTVNYVWEAPQVGAPKVPSSLYGRPGRRPWVTLGSGPVRAIYTQDTQAWAVSGGLFVELFSTQTAIVRGTVAVNGNPATISSNGGPDGSGGHQLFITAGGFGYVYDLVAQTLTEITDPGFPLPALMGGFLNEKFIVLKDQSNQFNTSNLSDGSTWDALDVAEVSQWPGRVLAINISHNELWPFSMTRVNPWYDSGASFPLQPVLGAMIEFGVLWPWTVQRIDNTLFWVSQTEQGGAVVVRADGYSAKIISPPAINTLLQRLPADTAARGWTCQMDGHAFYVLYLPTNDTSLVYDVSTEQWVEWALWDSDNFRWLPQFAQCHAFAFGKHLIGDPVSGTIYDLSFDYYADRRPV